MAEVRAANPIQIENAKPGSPDWVMVDEATNQIEGYASAVSVTHGDSIRFYVSTTDPTYTLTIYRMGWYDGVGARKVHGPVVRNGFQQVIPSPDPVTGLTECNWTDPYSVTVASDWTTGAYLVKLHANASNVDRYIPFAVRDDASTANHFFQLSVTTWQAYNNWGGKSLYSTSSTNGVAADKVSFNRPYAPGSGTGEFLWRWEYNMVRFLEREGYDLAYTTNVDTHRRGHLLQNHASFLSIGHDEYWSWEMRNNVEDALGDGVDLGFFSANSAYWQIRFEPSPLDGTLDRVMVGYKEDALQKDPFALDSDPSNDQRVTTQFRLPPVNRPESALLGVKYFYYPVDAAIVIDDVTSAPWVFAETGLTTGSTLPGLLGYEVDEMDAFTPAGTIRLGRSPFTDASGNTRYSHMTLYNTASATVFATGSIQWAWGLDDWNSGSRGARANAAAQQMTRNLLRHFAGASAINDCYQRLSPKNASVTFAAGGGSIALTTTSNCSWNITSSAPWLTVTSATTGSGSTTVTYEYTSNAGGPARNATLTIGEATFTLQQASGCTFTVSPQSPSIGAEGGTVTMNVTAGAGCTWTAASSESWATITSGASGNGNGTITISVAANEGPSRDAGIYINGVYHNLYQGNGCLYSAQPTSLAYPAGGGEGEIAITTNAACHWSSSSSVSWIVLTSGLSGQGTGATTYQIQPNTTGFTRTGSFTVAGVSVTVRQAADNCLYEFSPLWASYTAAAASGTIIVDSNCTWNAVVESGSSWLTITSMTASSVAYSVAQNTTGVARSGTIRIAGRAINITQNAPSMPMFSLTATATSTSAASLSWSQVSGATAYEVYRSSGGSSFSLLTTVPTPGYTNTSLQSGRAYLYRIRALGSGGPLAYSNIDVATTIVFVDPTIVPGVTVMRAVHLTQLRDAVSALHVAAAMPSPVFTDMILPGTRIRAVHIAELRDALAAARTTIGLPPVFIDPSLTIIRAAHVEQLRAAVR